MLYSCSKHNDPSSEFQNEQYESLSYAIQDINNQFKEVKVEQQRLRNEIEALQKHISLKSRDVTFSKSNPPSEVYIPLNKNSSITDVNDSVSMEITDIAPTREDVIAVLKAQKILNEEEE